MLFRSSGRQIDEEVEEGRERGCEVRDGSKVLEEVLTFSGREGREGGVQRVVE